jgi:hypothetical protein
LPNLFTNKVNTVAFNRNQIKAPMPKVKPPKFARPELLRKLKPSSLLDLFNPYRPYLASRDFDLPISHEAKFDIEGLGLVLATSIETTPAQMLEELEMLEILSDGQSLFDFEDHHCELVKRLRTDGDSDAAIALKILRQEPDAAWEAFDKRAIKVRRVMTILSHDEFVAHSNAGSAREA